MASSNQLCPVRATGKRRGTCHTYVVDGYYAQNYGPTWNKDDPMCNAYCCKAAAGYPVYDAEKEMSRKQARKASQAASAENEIPIPELSGIASSGGISGAMASFCGTLPLPLPFTMAMPMAMPQATTPIATAPPCAQPMLGAKLRAVMVNLDLPIEGSLPAQLHAANAAMGLEPTGSLLAQVDRLVELTSTVVESVAAPIAVPIVPLAAAPTTAATAVPIAAAAGPSAVPPGRAAMPPREESCRHSTSALAPIPRAEPSTEGGAPIIRDLGAGMSEGESEEDFDEMRRPG
jgi:hypothetical protein